MPRGRGREIGRDYQAVGGGRGRNDGDRRGAGVGGRCLCPECGNTIRHITNQPCNQIKCPKCGAMMTRE